MSDTFQKVKIWTKLSALGLLVLFFLIFSWENYSNTATVWLFGSHTMSVLEMLVLTFIFAVVLTLLARPIYHTLKQISQLRSKPAAPAPPSLAPMDPSASAPLKP